jgi:hypothetical protein
VAEQTLRQEAERLEADVNRDAESLTQTQQALEDAFEADLIQTSELTPQWVRDATRAYVSARQALWQHQKQLEHEKAQRCDNLLAAAEATRRASQLLERQDELITQTLGVDAWRLMDRPTESLKEDWR